MDFTFRGDDTLLDWIAAHPRERDRCEALLLWVEWVCRDPDGMTEGAYQHAVTGRTIRFSNIIKARTRATFVVFKTPVRFVNLVSIRDDLYVAH